MPIIMVLLASSIWWLEATAQPAGRAAATITEADVRRRVNLIADDSMGGRDTPSPGLEKTAQYLATEFRRMGLRPAGDSGSYFQRYGVRIRDIDPTGSSITFVDPDGGQTRLGFATDAKLVFGAPPSSVVTADLVLGGGPLSTGASLSGEAVQGRILIVVGDWTKGPLPLGQSLLVAANAGARLLVLSVNDDSAFARLSSTNQGNISAEGIGWPAVVAVREGAVVAAIPEAAETLAQVRASTTVTTVDAAGWVGRLELAFSRDERHPVPNVVGIVPGTDPALASEYLAISAHFDHVGSRCRGADGGGADKICNGADDNASGTTGLLELAEAFAHPDARPRRSVIFVAVSGEERGLWGSEYFARNPTVPIAAIVANINMDHLGRNWRDSIAVIGREHSDLGATVDRVAAEHRELNVGVLGDQWPDQRIYYRSDHYNFAREGVPILFFTNGFHSDYHAVTDSPDKIDAEKQARVVRLIFHTARAVANRTERPRWNPEGEQAIVRRKRPGAVP